MRGSWVQLRRDSLSDEREGKVDFVVDLLHGGQDHLPQAVLVGDRSQRQAARRRVELPSYLGIRTLAHYVSLERHQLLLILTRSPDRGDVFDAAAQGGRFPAPQGEAAHSEKGGEREEGSRDAAHGWRCGAGAAREVSLLVRVHVSIRLMFGCG